MCPRTCQATTAPTCSGAFYADAREWLELGDLAPEGRWRPSARSQRDERVTSSLIEARLHVGAARVDITPADLTELNPIGGGSFSAVHDPIHLRVLVIDDGTTEVALVGMDLVEVGDMRDLRARIDRELGIAADHVVITATHAHNAPRLGDVSPGALAHGGGPEQKAYTAWVYDRVIEAILAARAARRPARMGIGTGMVTSTSTATSSSVGAGSSATTRTARRTRP